MAAESPEIFVPAHPNLAEVVEGVAALAAARGQPTRAAELLGLAHTLHGFGDAASPEVARATAAARDALGAAAFEAAYARGQQLTRSDAVALVPDRPRAARCPAPRRRDGGPGRPAPRRVRPGAGTSAWPAGS